MMEPKVWTGSGLTAIEARTDIDELMVRIAKLSLKDQLQRVELVTRRIRESISAGTPAEQVRGLLEPVKLRRTIPKSKPYS